MKTRRELIRLGLISLFCAKAGFSTPQSESMVTEDQKGDPDVAYEHVTFDESEIDRLVRHSAKGSSKATFENWQPDLPSAMLSTARSFLGCSRATSPEQISEFLALFRLPFKNQNAYIPFCAAGLSFCALMAFSEGLKTHYDPAKRLDHFRKYLPDLDYYYFYPTVSCVSMYHIAAGRGRWIERKTRPDVIPKGGWIVLYDWRNAGTPDHCGIVAHAGKDKLSTIEFNTSGTAGGSQRDGGAVSEKDREYKYVRGFIVTDAKPPLN
jgi:hypothetical protein